MTLIERANDLENQLNTIRNHMLPGELAFVQSRFVELASALSESAKADILDEIADVIDTVTGFKAE